MGCVNNKWVCSLAELQLPNIPQVKKANAQQPFSIKLCDFDSDCIDWKVGGAEGCASIDIDEACFDFSE